MPKLAFAAPRLMTNFARAALLGEIFCSLQNVMNSSGSRKTGVTTTPSRFAVARPLSAVFYSSKSTGNVSLSSMISRISG